MDKCATGRDVGLILLLGNQTKKICISPCPLRARAKRARGKGFISHRALRVAETNLFIAVERTAMKNKLGADAHTGRRPEGL